MADITLTGDVRTEFGKGAARRMRVANLIPATIYAGGEEPSFLQLPAKETTLALRHTNALFELKFGNETKTAVVKDVQRNPVKRTVEHVDFYEVKAGEKIVVNVPVFAELAMDALEEPVVTVSVPEGDGEEAAEGADAAAEAPAAE